MTLDTAHSKEIYQGNGAATVFPFAFKVWNAAQVLVTRSLPGQVGETDVTAQSAIALTENGGTVTYLFEDSPLPSGATLAITRNMPFTQGVDLVSGSQFDPQVIEDALDQAAAERQQTLEMMRRAVILPATSDKSPQDMVLDVYTTRDDAQSASSAAQAAKAAADQSAANAAASANTAAQTVRAATAEAVNAATGQADAAAASAAAAAQSAIEAAEAVPENLVQRVTAVEAKTSSASTTTPGIGRVATQADMTPGAEVAHGPAFLDATSVKLTAIPTASTIPQANAKAKLAAGWIPGLFYGDIRLLPFSPGDLATYCPGWYFCNGDRYALTGEAGSKLNALPASFKTAWGITISGSNISVPNLFYSDGRGYYLRAVNGTTKVVGSVELDAMRELSGSFVAGLGGFEGGEFTGVFRQGSSYNIYAAQYRTGPVASRTLFSVSAAGIPTADEFRTIYRGMTPAIFLGD